MVKKIAARMTAILVSLFLSCACQIFSMPVFYFCRNVDAVAGLHLNSFFFFLALLYTFYPVYDILSAHVVQNLTLYNNGLGSRWLQFFYGISK